MATTIVFVHGYSVTNLNTYGELPLRLRSEALNSGLDLRIEEIFLGRYISFNDVVTLNDISRAFDTAVKEQMPGVERFVCITHSTGGPVIRNWWNMYYKTGRPPLSHLIMLAPANFGSALARLGKSRLSRIKTWIEGVEPGQGVLDWLECGSEEAWQLNKEWIQGDGSQIGPEGVFPFVVTGQSIDRKLYDNLNSYTGELGSDGVVRTASTNLNSRYIRLVQDVTSGNKDQGSSLVVEEYSESPVTAFRIVKGKSHSGDAMGILKSVKKEISDTSSAETVRVILDCIKVADINEYKALIEKFEFETSQVQLEELVEIDYEFFILERTFIHDRFSQVIFRVTDSEGYPVTDYDLIFTAGEQNDANHLPKGFTIDRQQNLRNPETITYFFNYDKMKGAPKNEQRDALIGVDKIGLQVFPRPDQGFVRFEPCGIVANIDLMEKVLKPNSTTLIDIVLQRQVNKEVFRLEELGNTMPSKDAGSFKNTEPGSGYIKS